MSLLALHDRLETGRRATLELLADARDPRGFWSGEFAGSSLATAVSICALALAERRVDESIGDDPRQDSWLGGLLMRTELSELVGCSLRWIARQQNPDGGWSDYPGGDSRLDATMAVAAAFQLTGVPARCADKLQRAREFIAARGGVAAVRDVEGERRPVAEGVLTLYAAAGLTPWKKTSAKFSTLAMATAGRGAPPFTAAAVSREIVLAAVGLARTSHVKSPQPLGGLLSGAARTRAVDFLTRQQAETGGYLDSPVMTALVVGALASGDLIDAAVVRRGVEFLLTTVKANGSWAAAVDTNVRDTAAIAAAVRWSRIAFPASDEPVSAEDAEGLAARSERAVPSAAALQTVDWLLRAQQVQLDRDNARKLVGWSWTAGSGAVSSVYDTANALLALAMWQTTYADSRGREIRRAVAAAIDWLLAPQGPAGSSRWLGWLGRKEPGVGADATALMLRALHAWRTLSAGSSRSEQLVARLDAAIAVGVRELADAQQSDGSWPAARHGNVTYAGGANPVIGTAQVIRACCELGLAHEEMTQRGIRWLTGVQHACGGWGPAPQPAQSYARKRSADAFEAEAARCTVEETALAVAALGAARRANAADARASELGAEWLAEIVLGDAPNGSAAA
ncbi:MAG: hypothetical protein KDA44_01695, partial [Planctomycetales bacterium]|nr:hypothetical protein [Planctomycetales bacterium]